MLRLWLAFKNILPTLGGIEMLVRNETEMESLLVQEPHTVPEQTLRERTHSPFKVPPLVAKIENQREATWLWPHHELPLRVVQNRKGKIDTHGMFCFSFSKDRQLSPVGDSLNCASWERLRLKFGCDTGEHPVSPDSKVIYWSIK